MTAGLAPASAIVQITREGFGRALITVGKLVVMDRTLCDVHRLGFQSLSKMKSEVDKHLAVAIGVPGVGGSQRPPAGGTKRISAWAPSLDAPTAGTNGARSSSA
jgi:hypothetical protein